MSEIMEKTCTRCEVEKPIEEFYGDKRSYCKECEKTQKREYHATPIGKARLALNDSKKAVRRIERETGREIKDDLSIYDVALVFGKSECIYCGEDIPMENRSLDHIIPLKYQGENTFSNVTMACRSCNSRKSDYPALSYLHQQKVPRLEGLRFIDSIARRDGISYHDAYMRLFKNAVTYFEQQREAEKLAEEGENGVS